MSLQVIDRSKVVEAKNIAFGISQDFKHAKVSEEIEKIIQQLKKVGDLSGKDGELLVAYPNLHGIERIYFIGVGKSKEVSLEKIRRAIGLVVKRAVKQKVKELVIDADTLIYNNLTIPDVCQAIVLSGKLAQYAFNEFKPKNDEKSSPIRIVLASEQTKAAQTALSIGAVIGESVNYSRTLANRPGNVLYPKILANEAKKLAVRYPVIRVKVLEQPALEKEGFGALLAVGAGSQKAPCLIKLEYKGRKSSKSPIALVGKGITFDSGGICIKPAAKMDEMRFDMCGAAAVLGIFQAVAQLKLNIHLIGIIPAAENMPSGSASRPGDIVKSLSGKTVEILNTDAEGRLILADALTYASKYKPRSIIDLATLTGAVVVALGNQATGLISNRQTLANEILKAGERSGERVWQLPLWDEYKDLLKSEVADIANIGSKPGAGTIVGGAFLEKFVEDTPWVHLDIAGTAWCESGPVFSKGATGVGVRLLLEWLLHLKS